ncbi:MAG: ATP-binding protein [Pseudomonadales bacterium]|nr:ATP-binding protein [Pseudomonadales bacterium]
MINHIRFLWNGGLDPTTASLINLRERRTLSVTIFCVIPVAVLLIVSNLYTGGERDNIYIAVATGMLIVSLYIQAYAGQRQFAANLAIFSYWLVMVMAMTTVGIGGNTWAWLLCLPAIATLVGGRLAGVIWAVICALTLWAFAWLQFTGYEFEYGPDSTGVQPITLAFEATLVLIMLTAAIFVFRSGQQKAEKRLSTAVNQLEKEVHERTMAEEEARSSEHAKATFLAAMSHELRTPLNGVIGASQLLQRDGGLTEKKQELVNVVLRSSETLLELVNNVLDLSRLDSDSIELEEIPVDLRELLSTTVAPLGFQAREKGINFSVVVEDDIPPWVIGDPTRLRQIILNLVGNAVKFTNSGEIEIVMDTALERIRLKITDSGIGIASDAQASLFEPYVQASAATQRKFGGSGLGLTIVKRLVSAMKGKIVVDSVPGRGSVFTVFLPLEACPAPLKRRNESNQIRLPGLSIVVADDNAVNRMILCRMLEEDGHDVVTMSNGREVLEYMPNHEVSAVFMDLQMPVMDGVSAMKRIRAMDGRRAKTPVIAVTANVITEKKEEMEKMGMNGFLTKPFRHAELREVLSQAVRPQPYG